MAVVRVGSPPTPVEATSGSFMTISSYTPEAGSDRCLAVMVMVRDNDTVTSVEWNGSGGDAFTSAAAIQAVAGGNSTEVSLWRLVETGLTNDFSTARDIRITFTGNISRGAQAIVVTLTDVHQTTPNPDAAETQSSNSTTTLTDTVTSETNALVLEIVGRAETTTTTPWGTADGTDNTRFLMHDQGEGVSDNTFASYGDAPGAASVGTGYSDVTGTNYWVYAAISFAPTATAPGRRRVIIS